MPFKTESIKYHVEVEMERQRQFDIWGNQHRSKEQWLAILVEEVGEVAKAILEKDDPNYREELIQVAATVITTLEDLDSHVSTT